MWGDRELTDWEGREFNEKEFSSFMKVQFTPTIIFLDSKGEIVLRLNGYQSIEKMHVVLDYVSTKKYLNQTFARYINSLKTNAVGELNKNILFEPAPHLLTRSDRFPAQKYLAVFFEEPNCPECDTFHQTFMKLDQTKALFKSMQVIQLNALSDEKLITPSGKRSTASQWYDDLKLTYKPAVVFFDKQGKEIIRKDAFFKTYHFHGIMTYVLSGEYKEQPNFQRYLEGKSDKLRDQGITVDIWK
ncbi:thioredoxin SoxW [hydrothermal vent metagenome]|uniref:Thioredoxin SoxW n=1 Tax=hydrothermal vent metagenome TaxID=652676 RepID=A0A1W1DEN7_9ZZZZ